MEKTKENGVDNCNIKKFQFLRFAQKILVLANV